MYEQSPSPSSSSGIELRGPLSSHSRPGSKPFRSGYESSHSDDRQRRLPELRQGPPQKHSGNPKWMSQVRDWLSVSEPTAQAMKQQKLKNSGRQGAALKDTKIAGAARVPISLGQIPHGATTSATGPTPEEALKKRMKEREARETFVTAKATASISSRDSHGFAGSVKEINPATPAGW